MQASKEFLKTKGVFPKISFKDRQAHTVKLGSDKMKSFKNEDGELVEGVKYLVSEAGVKKTFFTASAALIGTLSQYEPNDEVSIQMKSRKNEAGKFVSYYETNSAKAPQAAGEDNELPPAPAGNFEDIAEEPLEDDEPPL